MSELPAVTGREAIQAFARIGFLEVRVKGSHHVLKRKKHPRPLTVPVHLNKTLKKGTLRQLIRSAGVTVEEFVTLLER